MDFDVFKYEDYRSAINGYVKSQNNSWGIWAKIAQAANCKPSYLSQAMKSKTLLTPDHMLGIAQFIQLSEAETNYFLLLLDHARAGTKKLRDYFHQNIRKQKKEREDLSHRLNKPRIEIGSRETLYYSSWHWAALHIIVSIPHFQTENAIAERLHLPISFVKSSLEQLSQHNIVEKKGQLWKLKTQDIHIPKGSVMIGMHHSNWRQRAVQDSLDMQSDGVHYTAVYSLSVKDAQTLKDKVYDLIEQSRKIVAPSKEEEIIAFCCDLYRV